MSRPTESRRPGRLPCGFLVTALGAVALLAPAAASAADGDMDLSFGTFGRAVRGPGIARAIVARGDGSLRVAISSGLHFGVLALHPNGSIDESFGDDGVRMVYLQFGNFGNFPTALFERPGGQLLLVANTDDQRTVALVQLTAEGDLDFDFGTEGVRLIAPGDVRNAAYGAALQGDGKVVFVGECFDCGGPTIGTDSWVARYTDTGSHDPGFGTTGSFFFDAVEGGTDYDIATAVAIDDLGRIVVGGAARFGDDEEPYVARLTAAGVPDPSFAGSDGIRTLTDLAEQHVVSVAVEPGTRKPVVATGDRSSSAPPVTCAVARLRSSGSLDTAFSGDGIRPLTLEEGSNLHKLLLQSDGKIVVAGSIDGDLSPVEGFLVARLLPDGTFDDSFAEDGIRRTEFDLDTNGRDVAMTATLSGGRLVAAGLAIDGGAPQVALLRTVSALVFQDGFERGSTAGWL